MSDDGIFYFFCQAERPSHRTASNVLRGVIWLFVSKRPGLKSYIRKEYDQAGSNIFTDHNAWYALSGILSAILEDETSADCVIIIDALDECTEGREKLIGYISQCSMSYRAKWVISSRNWDEIKSQLDAAPSQVRLHLELSHDSISHAVLRFVDTKIDGLNSTYDQPSRELIRKHLLNKAKDTFLWLALVCQELENSTVKRRHISSILECFPPGLNELYKRMISHINIRDFDWCKAILNVVAVALRPLSLQELAAADETLTQWIEDKETLSSLVTSCGSLLTIRGDTVYTVHQSVNDFLHKAPQILPSGVGYQHYSIFLSSMNVMRERLHRNLCKLKDSCVLIDEIDILEDSSLTIVAYACVYWVDHFCAWLLIDNRHQRNLCYATITSFFKKKYLYWLEAMSLLGCTSEAIKAMQKLDKALNGRVPDELKLLVNDAVRFGSKHRAIMDAAPLQLYGSALIFTPQLSKIKGSFNQEISQSIGVLSPNFQHWDACLQTIPGIASPDNGSFTCKFSPDGRQIATISSNEDSLLLIDASTGGLIRSIKPSEAHLFAFTFHPSGHSLVTFSGYIEDEQKLTVFHLPNGEESASFAVYGQPFCPSFSLDGEFIAFASDLQNVEIWNVASQTKVDGCHAVTVRGIQYISWISIHSHPRALLIVGRMGISIWGLDKKHQMSKLMSLTGITFPNAAAVSHDRTCCAVVHEWKEVVLYSWGSCITLHKIVQFDRMKRIDGVSWVADDRLIALCGVFGIEIWDLGTKGLVAQVRGDHVSTIFYGRHGRLASLGFENGTLKVWSLDSILTHSEPFTQQSVGIVEPFITSPSGKVAIFDGMLNTLSIAVDCSLHHLPQTLQNSTPGSYSISRSLAFSHEDSFAMATNGGFIDVFNFDHDTGLYYCERRIEEPLIQGLDGMPHVTIQFWGQGLIIGYGPSMNFWDLKTGKLLQRLSIPDRWRYCTSTIAADGRVAWVEECFEVVIWDVMRDKEIQRFEAHIQSRDCREILDISLDSSGVLAIYVQVTGQEYIAIGNTNGTWIGKYSLFGNVPTLSFLTPTLLDTGFGVLKYDMPTVTAEDHWDPRYLRLFFSKSEAWLMKGSRRILWIPRQDVDPERFSIQTDLGTGKSTVTLVHDGCVFILSIKIDSI
ncbi:related to vegetatible incompatibility protein HET-E-1 [Fusarium mangiferae]|uniref:Related to vegetatible incompatibility protein HET-E-1 n=1 Tax=Fusarium mangiferae TaxID=192010 RepID=A0A1L7U3F5_FUSMA|nr:uncharacterized protein FMAN_10809 [Fusarium mangiferae]CVL05330.1 related to vegetatible incompatibility protein HET-E-1 [Fusarium mangiferae]